MSHGWQPKITMKILKVPPTLGWYWAPEDPPDGKGQSEIDWCMSNSPSPFGNPEQLTDYHISDDIASSAPAQPKISPAQHCRLAL